MHLLVTGGAGFIGGHLAEAFVADGHDVVVLDSLDPFYDVRIKRHTIERCREQAETGDGSYRFVEGDIRERADIETAIEETDVVFHQAAQAGVRGVSTSHGATTRSTSTAH
jgi:Nucleoside-diphosphate-sugar epimerases